jgi:hypothetical protein
MVQVGFNKPANDVVQGNYLTERLHIETVTDMYAGALVIKGTTDNDVTACGVDGKAIGWIGYGAANASDKPATRDTIYLDEAEVPIHNGGNFKVRAIYATAADVVKGDLLSAAANGGVIIGAAGTKDIIAVAAESVSSGATSIWVTSRL